MNQFKLSLFLFWLLENLPGLGGLFDSKQCVFLCKVISDRSVRLEIKTWQRSKRRIRLNRLYRILLGCLVDRKGLLFVHLKFQFLFALGKWSTVLEWSHCGYFWLSGTKIEVIRWYILYFFRKSLLVFPDLSESHVMIIKERSGGLFPAAALDEVNNNSLNSWSKCLSYNDFWHSNHKIRSQKAVFPSYGV